MEEDDMGNSEVPDIPSGEDEDTWGPSFKRRWMTKAEPAHGKKKIVQCNLLTMIIPKEIAVQFDAGVLLTIALQSNPIQETAPANAPPVMTISDEIAVHSLVRTGSMPCSIFKLLLLLVQRLGWFLLVSFGLSFSSSYFFI